MARYTDGVAGTPPPHQNPVPITDTAQSTAGTVYPAAMLAAFLFAHNKPFAPRTALCRRTHGGRQRSEWFRRRTAIYRSRIRLLANPLSYKSFTCRALQIKVSPKITIFYVESNYVKFYALVTQSLSSTQGLRFNGFHCSFPSLFRFFLLY